MIKKNEPVNNANPIRKNQNEKEHKSDEDEDIVGELRKNKVNAKRSKIDEEEEDEDIGVTIKRKARRVMNNEGNDSDSYVINSDEEPVKSNVQAAP